MTSLLQRARLLDGAAVDAASAFALGTRAGAAILGIPAGIIAPGLLADLVAIDLEHPSLHPRIDLLKSIVYAMPGAAVSDVWIHGRQTMAAGAATTVDVAELLARVRELTAGWAI